MISVYPGKNGGIGKARRIAEFAAAHGLSASIGSNLEWDMASAAMGHLVVACPAIEVERYPGDMLGPDYHEFSIAREPLAIRGPLPDSARPAGTGHRCGLGRGAGKSVRRVVDSSFEIGPRGAKVTIAWRGGARRIARCGFGR